MIKNVIISIMTAVLSMTLPIWNWIDDSNAKMIIVGTSIFIIVMYITKEIDNACKRRARQAARRKELERGEFNV